VVAAGAVGHEAHVQLVVVVATRGAVQERLNAAIEDALGGGTLN
jgi:hypothetical protein